MITQVSSLIDVKNDQHTLKVAPLGSTQNFKEVTSKKGPFTVSADQKGPISTKESTHHAQELALQNSDQNFSKSEATPRLPAINANPEIGKSAEKTSSPPLSESIKRIIRSDSFYLEASVQGVKMAFTVDTGATRTIISQRVYNAIPKDQRPSLQKTTGLTDASGKTLGQFGTAIFSIELANGLHFDSEIIVANIEDEGLLGHDLLKHGNAEILYKEGIIQFMGVKIPCIQVGSASSTRKIRSSDHFIIPRQCEKVIDVFVERCESDTDNADNIPIILEPHQSFQDRYGLIMAASLSELRPRVTHKVRLMNPTNREISINQDVVLGTAEAISDIVTLIQTENPPEVKKSSTDTSPLHKIEVEYQIARHTLAAEPQNIRRVQEIQVPSHLEDLYQSATQNCTQKEQERVAETLARFADTFSKDEFDLGLTSLVEHSIDVGDHRPIKQPPRRVPLAFASEEENVIRQLEKQGIIRESNSPWASPICLVRKKSGKIRPCVDYRRLNEITKKDAFPLPRIQDCLDAVAGAKFLSTFDLTSGFHQIKIKESDIPKSAFCTKYGLYEYLTMPMGMTNSPAAFERLMEIVLRGLQWHTCLIYLDDILVFGASFEQHMERVDEVLTRIKDAGLKLKPEKCQLLQTSVDFLGHTISSNGVLPIPANLAKIQAWPVPTTPTHVRQILGLGSYYRRFVKGYSDLVLPLTQLTHKGKDFVWTDNCQKAFDTLKEKLIGSDVMAYPQEEGLFILDTDASDTQIAGVLSQMQGGVERVISYGSRTLNKAEKNYCITDKELLAIRHFVEYYRQYILGRHFTVRSDHQALTFLFKLKEPKSRIARWIEILSAYDFSIEYRKGSKHANADTLSRCPDPWDCQCSDIDNLESLKCGPCSKCIKRFKEMRGPQPEPISGDRAVELHIDSSPSTEGISESIRAVTTRSQRLDSHEQAPPCSVTPELNLWSTPQDRQKVQHQQETDSDLSPIIQALKLGVRPAHANVVALSPASRYYWSIWDSLSLHDGCMYRTFHRRDGTGSHLQFMVPKSLQNDVLYQMHNTLISGHLGRKKTLEKLLQRFYWFNVREDVNMWLLKCDTCASIKSPYKKPRAPLGTMLVGAPLDRLATDFLGPLPLTPRNNRYILLVTDHFTKWVEILAVPDQTATTCASMILNEVIARYGCPLTIHSNQGRCYESAIFAELCKVLEIRKTRTSARNPRCNGQAERFNRSLLRMVKSYLKGEQENWDLNLGCLAAAYRATPQESTGLTPNLLMLGREVRLPAELMYGGQCNGDNSIQSYGDYVEHLKATMEHAHKIARKHLQTSAKRQAETYDAKLSVYHYKVGDVVWVAQEGCRPGLSPKLQASYRGPCVIIHKYSDLNFKVQLSRFGLQRVVHHNKLKPYEGDNIPEWIVELKQTLV